ncbi:hypothetical protein [Sphingobium sp. HDIP04]|uniref:hypothetical protein n=1 Tax=Sphingobium sp. HDIP04 TaxID=428994 RepID=UPI0003878B88|nr:hypothetical protein [Sphingobium sp. HDIP04]EQA97249.1 hypothetical protein L286_23270 [Sphingobium sp. HDIP04]
MAQENSIIAALAAKAADEWRIPCSKNPNDDSLCKPKDDCVWGYEQGYLAALSTSPAGQEVPDEMTAASVVQEMARIKALFQPADGDKEDLITYAKEISHLRSLSVEPAGNGRESVEAIMDAVVEGIMSMDRDELMKFVTPQDIDNVKSTIADAIAKAAAERAALSSPPAADQEAMTPEEAWQELVEYDDRTSPEEYPDMALITFEELRVFMGAASGATHPAPALDGVREALEAGRSMLIRHHHWHTQQRTPDPEHGFIPADEYGDSALYEQTADAIDKIDAALAALSSPSEGESATVSREGEAKGGFACPVCDKEESHHHGLGVVQAWRNTTYQRMIEAAISQAFSDGAYAVAGAYGIDDPQTDHVIKQAFSPKDYALSTPATSTEPDTRAVCEQCGKLGAFFCDHVGASATSTERGR